MAQMSVSRKTVVVPERLDWRVMEPVHTDDGVPLHVRHWHTGHGALGTVILVHGLGEHIGRYDALANDLNAAHWHVCGYDHRGHGASGGARGRIPRDDSLLRDLSRIIDQVRETRDGPVVLLGHSLGGMVAARFVAQGMAVNQHAPSWHRRVDALVLSSPALELGLSAPQRALLSMLGPLAPDTAMNNSLEADWVSTNPEVVQAYRKDPLVHDRVTPRLVRFMVDGAEFVHRYAPVWSLPTLLLWAGADQCVSPKGSLQFAIKAPPEWVTAKCFESMAHEIFNEPERARPLRTTLRWLDEHGA